MGSSKFKLCSYYGCSFLCNFRESSYDELADGSYAVHYDDKHKDYEMRVKLEDGERNGETIVLKSGKPWMKLNYRDGIITGPMEKMDESGAVVLRGYLEDGQEKGLFKEYTDSVMTWMGRYFNGKRYSIVFKNEFLKGLYTERCLENGKLISISQYDDALQFMEGYCLCFDCIDPDEYYIKNETAVPVNQLFGSALEKEVNRREERKRDHCDEESDNLVKRIRFNPVPESNEDSLIRFDTNEKYQYGVWKEGDVVSEVKRSVFKDQVIEADLKSHEMRVFVNSELKEMSDLHNDCIDLDTNGKRWEGSVKDGKPFGYGVLYDEEGRKEYEGFMIESRHLCYGREYYPDIGQVKYDGCYFEGKRFGKGTLYDRNGVIEHDGLWNKDEPYSPKSDGRILDNHTVYISIPDNSFNITQFVFFPYWFYSLSIICIGINCFERVRFFILDGLNELEGLYVGKKSFTEAGDEPWYSKRLDGQFRITNCPKLEDIVISNWSFSDYHSFELHNLPALEFISVGEGCFFSASSFSLTGLMDELV